MQLRQYYKPLGHAERIERYEKYEKLYFGLNREVFGDLIDPSSGSVYIVQNFTRLISEFFSDLLFSEPPSYISDTNQEGLDELVKANQLNTLNLESSISNAYRGDVIYKIRKDEEGKVIIEDVPVMMYFPTFEEDNINVLKSVTVAWILEDHMNKKYVRKEIHFRDRIENKLFLLEDQRDSGGNFIETKEIEVPLNTLDITVKARMDNPSEEILITHIPNYKLSGHHFGISDIQSMESMLNEADYRITKLASVLDKHTDPILAVPEGVLDEFGSVQTGNFSMFEVTSSEGGVNKPEYITWDAQVDAVFKQIDLIAERISMFGRLPNAVINQKEQAAIPEAAAALKLKFLMALKKAERKKVYYDAGLKEVIRKAGVLGGVDYGNVQIVWHDGLPEDELVQLQILALEKQLGVKSQERATKERLMKEGLTEEEINDEIEKVKRSADVRMPNAKAVKVELEPREE